MAKAIAVDLVAVSAAAAGDFRAWPADQPAPNTSVVNYSAVSANGGLNIANGIILPICDDLTYAGCAGGDILVQADVGDAYLVADVTGYFTAEATDVTAVTAVNPGTGLTGGGSLTLGLLSSYQLPQGCGTNQIPAWSGSLWTCATPSGGGSGTVTSITAGTGLSGGTITTSGTLGVNFAGSGSAATAARSDHNHLGQAWSGGRQHLRRRHAARLWGARQQPRPPALRHSQRRQGRLRRGRQGARRALRPTQRQHPRRVVDLPRRRLLPRQQRLLQRARGASVGSLSICRLVRR